MIKRIFLVFIVMALLLLTGKTAHAVEVDKGLFDNKVQYDIYLKNNESDYTVVVNVDIVRVEEILGRKFLVVRPHDFTLNSADGFVAFDAIQAILPCRQIKVKSGERLRVAY